MINIRYKSRSHIIAGGLVFVYKYGYFQLESSCAQNLHDIGRSEFLEDKDSTAAEQSRVQAERGVFRCRSDQNNWTILYVWQENILQQVWSDC